MAHLRHRQGRRLPRRPGCRRDPREGGHRRGHRPREHGPAVQPHARGQDRPAPLRRPHRRPRQGARAPRLLRRRPHRPHDPADAVPELRQARHQLLQRVLRARPRHDRGRRRRAARRASSPTSSRPASCTSSRPRRSSSRPAASARSTRPPRTRTPSPATASASSGARACRSRTWSSSSSTRPASPASASCSPKAPAARARSCATPRGERFMERYAPTIKDLAPRDIVAPLHGAGGRRGPRRRPAQGLRAAGLHAPRRRGARDEAARHHRVRPHLPRRRPGVRARAGHADRALRDGRHPDQRRRRGARATTPPSCPASTPPASARASRCTARTASAPTRCSTSTSSASAPATTPSSTCKTAEFVPLPEDPAAERARADRAACATRTGTERIAVLRKELQDEMDTNAQVFRTDESLDAGHETSSHGAARALQERRTSQDKGKRFNTDLLEAVELGFLLDLAEVVVVLGAQPQGEPRRPHARRLPEARRRELHEAHDGVPVGRRRTPSDAADHIRLDWKPVVITRYQPMERKY